MSEIRSRTVAGLKAGDSFSIIRTFTEGEVEAFADLTRDYNPVHFDPRFTRAKGFRGPICHGLLVAGMISEIGGQMGWLASEMTFRFRKPVYPGDPVQCSLRITAVDEDGRAEAEALFTSFSQGVVLEATLKGILPGEKERTVMEAMVAEGDPTNKARA